MGTTQRRRRAAGETARAVGNSVVLVASHGGHPGMPRNRATKAGVPEGSNTGAARGAQSAVSTWLLETLVACLQHPKSFPCYPTEKIGGPPTGKDEYRSAAGAWVVPGTRGAWLTGAGSTDMCRRSGLFKIIV